MKWTKPSAETVAYFERIAPGPPLETRHMFGMPARFLNGHVLVGVFGNTFMLHLSEADREACIRAGAKPFAPMGREAREYVDVAPGTFDDRTLKEWIVRGMRYLGSLPPKLGAKRGKVDGEVKSRRGTAAPGSVGAPRSAGAPRSTAAPRSARPRSGTATRATERSSAARAGNASAKARRALTSTAAKGRTAAPDARRTKGNAAKSRTKEAAKSSASANRAKPKKAKTRTKTAKTRRGK